MAISKKPKKKEGIYEYLTILTKSCKLVSVPIDTFQT